MDTIDCFVCASTKSFGRSATMVLLYAMQVAKTKLKDAVDYVTSLRNVGLPGEHFTSILAAAEQHCFGVSRSGLWQPLRRGSDPDVQERQVFAALSATDECAQAAEIPPTCILPPKGIVNAGNSCFIACILQLLSSAQSVYRSFLICWPRRTEEEHQELSEKEPLFAQLGRECFALLFS